MKNRTKRKQGHLREISKEFIKKNLLNDLYPIPRRKPSECNQNIGTQTPAKIRNILQFLDYTQEEQVSLEMFQEKITNELSLSKTSLEVMLKGVRAEGQVVKLASRLVFLKDDCQQQILFLLRGLISTTYREVKQLIELLFFYHFVKVNQQEYKSIIRQFQAKKIYQSIQQIRSLNSQILTAKILSVLTIIFIKYSEEKRLLSIGPKTLILRRSLQTKFFNAKDFGIDSDYTGTTFYFSLKYTQALLKEKQINSYELMHRIHQELDLINKYHQKGMIYDEPKEVFVHEMLTLKNVVSSKVEEDYYHSTPQEPVVLSNKERTKSALREFKRRKSLVNIKSKTFFLDDLSKQKNSLQEDSQSLQKYQRSSSNDKPTKGFKEIYNTINSVKKMTKFSKITGPSTLKKIAKTANCEFQKAKVTPTGTTKEKGASQWQNLLKKIQSFALNNGEDQEAIQKEQKKKTKIQQIYKVFTNENKIFRDIPCRNLDIDQQSICGIEMGTKLAIKDMLKKQIVQFSAGLSINQGQINNLLAVKSCLQIQFLKIWIGQLYRCKVSLSLAGTQIEVAVKLNDRLHKIILHRGNNVLCQRYLTIWPTIRYLIYKKIVQLTIFKKYDQQLLSRKPIEQNLTLLCGQFYHQKFGVISKEQIEEINTCLDNIVKLVLVLQHYCQKNSFRYELSKQYRYNLASSSSEGEDNLKLNMITQIYLNEFSKIKLCTFLHRNGGKFYYVHLYSPREKLLTTLNNKSNIQIEFSIVCQDEQKTVKGGRCELQWIQLEKQLILHSDFVNFVKAVCAKISYVPIFLIRFVNFFSKRLKISDHPIFKASSSYDPPKIKASKRSKQQIRRPFLKHQSYAFIHRFKLQIVQNEENISEFKYSTLQGSRCFIKVQSNQFQQKLKPQVSQLPSTIETRKNQKNKNKNQEKLWRQQKKIRGKSYLIVIKVNFQNQQQFQAEFTLINRCTESKDYLLLNHKDLELLTSLNIVNSSHISSESEESEKFIEVSNKDKMTQLIELSNNLSFYYNHQVRKIFVSGQDGLYRHYFKQQRKQKYRNSKMFNRLQQQMPDSPRLQKFQFGCKLRVTKTVKTADRFALVTFKRNIINGHSFWEIILDFARSYIQYVCQLEQEQISFLLSDHNKGSSKQFLSNKHSGKHLLDSFLPKSSRFSSDSIKISLNTKHEELIDYKERIIGLFERNEIKVIGSSPNLKVSIMSQAFSLKQRIIEQWDHDNNKIYSVWLEKEKIEVKIQYPKSDLDVSMISQSQQDRTSFKGLACDSLGRIELDYAYRFYQMQNKEEEQNGQLFKICQFYLSWCKQQCLKYQQQGTH